MVKRRENRRGPSRSQKRLFFQGYGGDHSSLIAAAIYLGLLPGDRVPSQAEILSLRHFDGLSNDELGRVLFLGTDERGIDVYVIGSGPARDMVPRAVRSFLGLNGLEPGLAEFVDCLPLAGLLTRAGGFLSRRLGLIWIGRNLAAYGIRRNYRRFVGLAQSVRDRVRGKP